MRFDIEQAVTNDLIELIEQGGLLPWQRPWDLVAGSNALPFNFKTQQRYSGINVLLLWREAQRKGYQTSAWLTCKQANSLRARVRPGEKSVKGIFVKPIVIEADAETDEADAEDTQTVYMRRIFSVFNLEQIEGLEGIEPLKPHSLGGDAVVQQVDALAEAYCAATGLSLRYGGNSAFYSPAHDYIQIPLPTHFKTPGDYATTLVHELIHSTGHTSRLDRLAGSADTSEVNAGREAYAFEELIATLGEAFFCAELGIAGQNGQHASYIASWLKALKNDKSFIFKAAAAANKACQFLKDKAHQVDANPADTLAAA